MARIKSLKDLPPWFRLENYADAGGLSRRGWVAQFAVRAELLRMPASRSAANLPQLLYANPLGWLNDSGPLHQLMLTSGFQESVVLGPPYARARLMSGLDHLVIARQIGLKRLERVEYWATEFRSNQNRHERKLLAASHIGSIASELKQPGEPAHANLLGTPPNCEPLPKAPPRTEMEAVIEACDPYAEWRMAQAIFDPALPDWLLQEQFKRLVREARAALLSSAADHTAARRPAPSNWIRFSVLPLLDLQLWQLETGKQIPRRLLADAIFEPGEGGEDMLRDSSEPWAHALTTFSYLDKLASWAELEDWDQTAD